jgi:beta-N-acetylhexosaminidase
MFSGAPGGFSQSKKSTARAKAGKAARKPAAVAVPQHKRWMAQMTLAEKIAQLLVIPFYGENPAARSKLYRKYANEVGTLRVGGLILVNHSRGGVVQYADPKSSALFLNRMQKLAKVPLIVGGDFERGASMRVLGPTRFPHSMAFAAAQDLEASRRLGAVTARESRAMGVHWVFAPVADVNNNPDNPIINIRSYSQNPDEVSAHVKAYVEGARSDANQRVLVTVKHFPGHGDTAMDTHVGLGKIDAPLERLQKLEFLPFQAAIEAKVDAVMTAHLWVPAVEPEQIPATVSQKVLTGLLRKQLGFEGIITTDAMDMHGLSRQIAPGEAAVRAIEAGVDVLLMPPNPKEAVRAILAAVKSGRISRQRIDESLEKFLRAKVSLGLDKKRMVDVKAIPESLNQPADMQLAEQVADKAVTLVRNENSLLPLADAKSACWVILNESKRGIQGQEFLHSLGERGLAERSVLLDPRLTEADADKAVVMAEGCSTVVVGAFAGFRGSGLLSDGHNRLVERLQALGKPVVLAGLGNPYLLRGYPNVQAFLATFSTTTFSETAAVKAILGEIAIAGRLPVTIPGLAEYGAGLTLPRQAAAALKTR